MEAGVTRCIGLLGGSFDPVHRAHLALAAAFAQALPLDEVRFVPAGQPWQKDGLAASGAQRVAMLELALPELATRLPASCGLAIDTRELHRTGPSYTVETLAGLRREFQRMAAHESGGEGGYEREPNVSLVLLVGADQLLRLDTWHRWTELFELAHLAVATRPGFDLDTLPAAVRAQWLDRLATPAELQSRPHGCTWRLDGFSMEVSATAIRAALRAEDHANPLLTGFVPLAVLDYIRANRLYR